MALSYDYTTSRISVPMADAQPLLIQDLLNSIRSQEYSERGIADPAICSAAGKDDLGGGIKTGITINLTGTWKLNFAAGAYQATITGGNLSDALARIYNTGSPQVLVLSSAASTLAETGVSGLTAGESTQLMSLPSASATADAVWSKTLP